MDAEALDIVAALVEIGAGTLVVLRASLYISYSISISPLTVRTRRWSVANAVTGERFMRLREIFMKISPDRSAITLLARRDLRILRVLRLLVITPIDCMHEPPATVDVPAQRSRSDEEVQPLVDVRRGQVVVEREAISLDQPRLVNPAPVVIEVAPQKHPEVPHLAGPLRHRQRCTQLRLDAPDSGHQTRAPLLALHGWHASTKLSAAVSPPLASGMTWSIWCSNHGQYRASLQAIRPGFWQ
jgi:hypothetical protein